MSERHWRSVVPVANSVLCEAGLRPGSLASRQARRNA